MRLWPLVLLLSGCVFVPVSPGPSTTSAPSSAGDTKSVYCMPGNICEIGQLCPAGWECTPGFIPETQPASGIGTTCLPGQVCNVGQSCLPGWECGPGMPPTPEPMSPPP
jgi:hypothetical protein